MLFCITWGALQRGPGGPQPTQNFGWVGHSAFGPTNNWPVCSLIVRKISRIGATIRQILRLKCTNSLSAAASPQTQGERCPPHGAPPNCIYGAYYQGDGGKVEGRRTGERKEK